jgi:exopolyphosphatase/guanosine-5'-triphosphate,3'-diphosphate pyrophosphatase
MADGKVLYKRLNTTRLGEGLASSKLLKNEAIERSALAVAQFYAQAKKDGASFIAGFATAAVRTAENRLEFLERVKQLCGLQIEVIAGETEAEIGILGALGTQDGGVIDIGGASTEIVYKRQQTLTYKKSVDIGAVRLKDACGRDKNKLYPFCENAVSAFQDLKEKENFYAIGGTATTLAAWKLQLKEYRSEIVTGTEITRDEMRELARDLLEKRVEEIAALPCMPKGRADILAGGAVLFSVIMDKLNLEKITVSDRDNLEGYAIYKGWTK